MKLTVLSENTSLRPELEAEFGLSMYVEKGNTRLLFDLGERGAALKNAVTMGIDLNGVTAVAFSHNHRDHCGGFLPYCERFHPQCPVYVHQGFFVNKWWDHRMDPPEQSTYEDAVEHVGPPFSPEYPFRMGLPRFRMLPQDTFYLGDGIYLLGNFPIPTGVETVHPSSCRETSLGELTLDDFREEQICVIDTSAGLIVLTGCAHNGIMNILDTVSLRFPGRPLLSVYGGTHLVPPEEERIRATAEYLSRHVGCCGVCHCTGETGLAVLSQLAGYVPVGSGFSVEYPD